MNAKLYEIKPNGLTVTDSDEAPAQQAREFLHRHPPRLIREKLAAAWLWVLLAALLDIGLMYDAQSRAYTDAFGQFTGSPLALAAVSCMSLAWFVLLGLGLESKKIAGWVLAALGYALLLAMLMARLQAGYADLFADLWAAGRNAFLPDAAGDEIPVWLMRVGVGAMAIAYTAGGLCFLLGKRHLGKVNELRRHCVESRARLDLDAAQAGKQAAAQAAKLEREHLKNPANVSGIARRVRHHAKHEAQAALARQQQAAEVVLHDLKTTTEEKAAARKTLAQLQLIADALKACVVCLLLTVAARPVHAAMTTAEILETAPSFVLLLDVSPNPATDADYLRLVWPEIEKRLRSMPLGASVVVKNMGDNRLSPLVFRARIQAKRTREGDTQDGIARSLKALVMSFPDRFKDREHQQSEIIGGFFEAAHDLNARAANNVIVAITDGIENSQQARCAETPCKLPPPSFTLAKTSVYMYGVGQGLPSPKAQEITRAWEGFLRQSGAALAEVRGK